MLQLCHLLPKLVQLAVGKKTPTYRFSLGREREEQNIYPVFQLLVGLNKGLVSISPNTGSDEESVCLGCLGITENQRAQWLEALQDSVLQSDTRGNKILEAPEKLVTIAEEDAFPENFQSSESLDRFISESISLYKDVL